MSLQEKQPRQDPSVDKKRYPKISVLTVLRLILTLHYVTKEKIEELDVSARVISIFVTSGYFALLKAIDLKLLVSNYNHFVFCWDT